MKTTLKTSIVMLCVAALLPACGMMGGQKRSSGGGEANTMTGGAEAAPTSEATPQPSTQGGAPSGTQQGAPSGGGMPSEEVSPTGDLPTRSW